MTILYYDLFAWQEIHANFNAALLAVLYHAVEIDGNPAIELHSENLHARIVYNTLRQQNILIKSFPCLLLNKNILGGKLRTILRDFLGIFYVIQAFFKKNKNTDLLFFGIAYPLSLKMIYYCGLLTKKHAYVCLHGEIEVFVKNSTFYRNKKYFSLIRHELENKNDYIHYVVLGKPIYNVIKHVFALKPVIINPPYLFYKNNLININFAPLVVGQIGSGSMGKGTQYLFQTARAMKSEVKQGKIKFVLIGKLSPSLRHLDEGLVEYHTGIVEQSVFEELIKEIHFTLQLRDENTAQAVAPASFLDSLKFDKPFFALHNQFLDFYLKQAGMIDNSFDSIDDIVNGIRTFIKLNDKEREMRYKERIQQLQPLKELFSVQYNAGLLDSQLKYQ